VQRETVDVYEQKGAEWASRRKPLRRADARAFGQRVPRGAFRADLGCGAGRYLADIGEPAVGLDAAHSMLLACRDAVPGALLVQGDLEALPFAPGTMGGGWANMSYVHLAGVRLPLALADLHRSLVVGAPVDLQVLAGDYEGDALENDDVGGRFFCAWTPDRLADVLTGAGFGIDEVVVEEEVMRVRARRLRTLPDYVGAGMRVLVVGLNPSIFSADAGVGFARRSNRFWECAFEAGLASRDRDPLHALERHGTGMTDLVKRPTVRAAELASEEYRHGLARVDRLVRWLQPKGVCMVGLSGWRAAVDPGASPGPQDSGIGGRPLYVMPSTSGANARSRSAELVTHLRAALRMAK
jgi:double-stranded uracil-DNA glycosylase